MGHAGRLTEGCLRKKKRKIKLKERKKITRKYDAYGLEEARSF